MDKKGLALRNLVLIFAFFLGLGTFLYYYTTSEIPISGAYIGEFHLNLIKNFQKGDDVLLYIDQSAKYSLQQAIYDLAQNGGFSKIEDNEEIDSSGKDIEHVSGMDVQNKCGRFKGVAVWYEIKKNNKGVYEESPCFDESSLISNLKHNLENIFNRNLNQYLINHPENLLKDNYEYLIQGNLEIIGKAIDPIKFDIVKDEAEQIVKEATTTNEGLKDFTGTDLCKKGTKCLLTEEAYNSLLKAQKKAKEKGVSLEVTSAYRTLKEQEQLWKRNPNSGDVCPPNPNCPHHTGNAVDVRFKGKTTATMTKDDWKKLHEIMTACSNKDDPFNKDDPCLVRYSGEPWHFECCGTARYLRAKKQGVTAIT